MTLSLSKCLCVSFQMLADTEINLEGEKGDFYSKVKNIDPGVGCFVLGFYPCPLYFFKHFFGTDVKQTCLYIYQLSHLIFSQKINWFLVTRCKECI